MTEPITETVAETETPVVEETPTDAPETDDLKDDELPEWAKAKIQKANNEAKNLRNRLKDQEPLVAAAQAAERERMSEADRHKADADALRTELAQRDTQLLVERYKIPEEYLEFIGEGTFDEKEARAAKVGQMVQPKGDGQERPPSDRPVESLKPGASPSTPPVEDHSYPAEWGFSPTRGA